MDGCTVAYIAGCRVEWAAETRGGHRKPVRGIPHRREQRPHLPAHRRGQRKADFVVVYEHWGMEGDTVLEGYQTDSGREFIDAGADVVVGDHPMWSRASRWYNGKPIFYSMGNYWFSSMARYTMLLQIELGRDEAGRPPPASGWCPPGPGGTVSATHRPGDSQREFMTIWRASPSTPPSPTTGWSPRRPEPSGLPAPAPPPAQKKRGCCKTARVLSF